MTEMHLRAGLFVFAVGAALLALLFGHAGVAWLIILAFIAGFAGVSALPSVTETIVKILKMGPQ